MRERISQLVSSSDVVVFIKGTRAMPQCGFSAAVVDTLNRYLPGYVAIDVLRDQGLRESIKVYSQWPTIPQIYVRGEFVGGCDILREMDAAGELATLLESKLGSKAAVADRPRVTLTASAAAAVRDVVADVEGSAALRLTINASFYAELSVETVEPGELTVTSQGVQIMVDPQSAARAEGVCIDFVNHGSETGFRVDNPNAPTGGKARVAAAQEITVSQLQAALAAGESLDLLDVRTDSERRLAAIDGSTLLDAAEEERLVALPRSRRLVFYCHHGVRSLRAAQRFVDLGFERVESVAGGIDAWSTCVDSSVARY
ncbi:MAG: Grx4 family monothiol glutaredoxin [Nannocystaceae bacterium]